jgi:hypothetical protein
VSTFHTPTEAQQLWALGMLRRHLPGHLQERGERPVWVAVTPEDEGAVVVLLDQAAPIIVGPEVRMVLDPAELYEGEPPTREPRASVRCRFGDDFVRVVMHDPRNTYLEVFEVHEGETIEDAAGIHYAQVQLQPATTTDN